MAASDDPKPEAGELGAQAAALANTVAGRAPAGPPPEEAGPSARSAALPLEVVGRYDTRAEVLLGQGGVGRVALVHEVPLGRDVARKELLPAWKALPSSMGSAVEERFLREARVLAQLEHPGVVPVYELGRTADGAPFFTMRRVQGRTLAQALEQAVGLEERLTLLPHLLQVVQTVAYAHARRVVHRDLKPANVMVGPFGETLVMDWGLARVEGLAEPAPSSHSRSAQGAAVSQTLDGLAIGTPSYMSPEQATGQAALMDAQSDVWTLGVMLFELLTGELPFPGDDAQTVMAKIADGKVPEARELEPKAPRALGAVVLRAMARDRAHRYATAGELAEALEQALRLRPQLARARLPPWLWPAALAAALLALGLTWSRAVREKESAARESAAGRGIRLALAQEIAERAQAALEVNDAQAARSLALQALNAGEVPLARGVLMAAVGQAPTQLFAVKTPAGCGAVASNGALGACATLGAVELYGAAGEEAFALGVVPPVWQHAVAFLSPTRLAAGGDDRLLRVWNVETRALVGAPVALPSEVRALAPIDGGALLGLRDGSLVQVELPSGALTVLAKLEAPIRAVATDGATTLAATREGFVWSEGMLTRLTSRNAPAGAVAFAAPGQPLAGLMRSVVDVAQGRTAEGHLDDVTALVALSASRWVSGSADGTVRWWSPQGRELGRLAGFAPGVQALAHAGKGVLLVATRDRRLEAWRLPPETVERPSFAAPQVAQAWFPEGWLVAGLSDGQVQKLQLEDGEVQTLELKHAGPVRALARVPQPQAPSAIRLLTGGEDGRVQVQRWNGEVEVLEASTHKVRAVAASPEGARAAWALDDGAVVLFSLETMKEISRTPAVAAGALAFAPQGAPLVALARDDKRVSLLDGQTGAEVAALDGHDGAVTALAFSPNGRVLATGSADTSVRLWEAQTHQQLAVLQGPGERVGALAFSPDGQQLAVGSDDGSLYLWSLASGRGQLLAVLRLHLGDVSLVAFAGPDVLVAAGSDRTVRVLPLAEGLSATSPSSPARP